MLKSTRFKDFNETDRESEGKREWERKRWVYV